MAKKIRARGSVRYMESIRYWGGPLSEVPLYVHVPCIHLDHVIASVFCNDVGQSGLTQARGATQQGKL